MSSFAIRNAWDAAIGVLEDNIFEDQTSTKKQAVRDPVLINRRKENRFFISLPIRHRLRGQIFRWASSRSINVSQNGIRLTIDSIVPIGTPLQMKIKLPNSKKELRMEGIVVWEQASPNGPEIRECGVAFESLRKLSRKEKLIEFLADSLCRMALRTKHHLVCEPAESTEEIRKAYQLVYREYQKRGYCRHNPQGIHFNFRCIIPGSKTFVLKDENRIVGTVTLIMDSEFKLPMESIFSDKISFYRRPSKKLAEVSMLAVDSQYFGNKSFSLTDFDKLASVFRLFKIMFDYARTIGGVTDLFIAMHPKHRELYQYLTFETIGPVRNYTGARGNPAVPMRLDIGRAVLTVPWNSVLRAYFIDRIMPTNVLSKGFTWDTDAIKFFLGEGSAMHPELDSHKHAYLKKHYPKHHSDENAA